MHPCTTNKSLPYHPTRCLSLLGVSFAGGNKHFTHRLPVRRGAISVVSRTAYTRRSYGLVGSSGFRGSGRGSVAAARAFPLRLVGVSAGRTQQRLVLLPAENSTLMLSKSVARHTHLCSPEFIVLTAVVDAEPEDPGRVLLDRRRHNALGVRQQEQVAEGRAEVGAVQVGVLGGARVVGLVAARAEHLHRELPGYVGQAHGQHGLALAERARAPTEVHVLKLFVLCVRKREAR